MKSPDFEHMEVAEGEPQDFYVKVFGRPRRPGEYLFNVSDIDATINLIVENGGKLQDEKFEMGRFAHSHSIKDFGAYARDNQGELIFIHQTVDSNQPPIT